MKERTFWQKLYDQRQLAVLTMPFLFFIFIFNYLPIWGWIYAFQDFKPHLGVFGSKWVGLYQFKKLFTEEGFYTGLRNTLAISSLKLVFGFVASITLALMLNEVKNKLFKRSIQTISYIPHFISWVVAANLVFMTLSPDGGIVNEILVKTGLVSQPVFFLGEGKYFWLVASLSNVWKEVGWDAIIYLSAITAIDLQIYESADIDGAGRLRKIFAITLPSIYPTIKILLIMSIGFILSAGFEQIYLMQKPATWDFSETLELYIFKYGINNNDWSYSTAAGIFNSVVSLILVLSANRVSRLIDGEKLF